MKHHRYCDHACCIVPFNPAHMHLFEPSVCPDCQALTAQSLQRKRESDDRRVDDSMRQPDL